MEETDVIVIGSGAGGGPMAFALSQAGFRVVVFEKGPCYSRTDYFHDEVLLGSDVGFFVPSLAEEPHVLILNNGTPQRSSMGWLACCVGGGTTHMGACLYRLHPDDFEVRTHFGKYERVEDWPYAYADLERYYSRAEWAIGVSGAA